MIYCNLKGGLGNMLFQIAYTKSISVDKGVNCSFPNLLTHLEYLNTESVHNDVVNYTSEYNQIFVDYITDSPKINIPLVSYPFHYENIETPSDDFIIDGFFQSEKYFKHNRYEIIELFKIPNNISKIIDSKYGHLLNNKTTSVHIRRGDYTKFPNHHPVQSLDYYLNAMSILKDETDTFIVFSDDIDWCKSNFKDDNIFFIENEKDYIEIYLMSMCDNNIISNSSFSWWGAWLNINENKKVIGPKLWFGPAIQFISYDIIPENWLKI